jgi:hypothetical protein
VESPEERIAAYQASIEGLIRAIAELRAEQRRMKWLAIATAVIAPIAYLVHSLTAAIVVVIIGGSLFLVGHYVVFMHIHENKLTIKSAKQSIAALRRVPDEKRAT